MTKIETKCFHCNAIFLKSKKEFNRNESRCQRHFCSRNCYFQNHTTGINTCCTECDKAIWKKQSELTNAINVFCSRSCSIRYHNRFRKGEKHPLWNGAQNEYRQLAFENFKPICFVCGYDIKEVLEVHHKDKDRANNALSNLVILCRNHHTEIHKGIRTL